MSSCESVIPFDDEDPIDERARLLLHVLFPERDASEASIFDCYATIRHLGYRYSARYVPEWLTKLQTAMPLFLMRDQAFVERHIKMMESWFRDRIIAGYMTCCLVPGLPSKTKANSITKSAEAAREQFKLGNIKNIITRRFGPSKAASNFCAAMWVGDQDLRRAGKGQLDIGRFLADPVIYAGICRGANRFVPLIEQHRRAHIAPGSLLRFDPDA